MGAQTGRPTIITDATVRKLEQAFRDGFTVTAACRFSGIGTSTYYDHLAADNVFSDRMALAQDYATHKAKLLVIQEINDGNLRAAQWWLERKAKDEFGVNAVSDEARRQQELSQHQPEEPDAIKELIELMRENTIEANRIEPELVKTNSADEIASVSTEYDDVVTAYMQPVPLQTQTAAYDTRYDINADLINDN